MEIKSINYVSISGGTLSAFIKNDDICYHEIFQINDELITLKTLLENKFNVPLTNFIAQICESESLSEERLLINFRISPETSLREVIFFNKSDMTNEELSAYEAFKSSL
jgi:hypothetical protein